MSLLLLNNNNSNIINNNTTPSSSWKFLGSVSSVSPINKLLDEEDLKLTTSTSTKIYNGTGYFTEDVEENDMLNDLQTISLACLATLVPLIIVLMVLFGLRFLLGKYQHNSSRRRNNLNDSSTFSSNLHETAKETSSSLNQSSIPLHAHLLNDLDSTETHHRIEICSTTETSSVQMMEMLDENVSISTNNFCNNNINNNNRRSNTNNTNNGSIITMTLKNNHLIVETEERNDIQEDSKETTVRYSPSTDNGIFVVEVQQGMRKSPSSNSSATPDERPSSSLMRTDECAIVHNPPESDNDAEEEEEAEEEQEAKIVEIFSRKANTGLTSSAISLDSLRRNYCYNNNQFSGYDLGNFGYSVYSGYDVAENSMNNDEGQQIISKKITNNSNKNNVDEENFSNKPKIMSALYKSSKKTMNFNSANLNPQEKLLIEQIASFDQEQQQQELSSDFYANK